LIDQQHVVDLAVAEDIAERQRARGFESHAAAKCGVKRVGDERALARAADAGDQAKRTERKLDGDVFQVVAGGAGEANPAVVGGAAVLCARHAAAAREKIARDA
jgi:hypothetical protein